MRKILLLIYVILIGWGLTSCNQVDDAIPDGNTVLAPESGVGIWEEIQLNSQEENWLAEGHTVRVPVGDWPPYIIRDGEVQGIAIDYITLISHRFGIEIEYYRGRRCGLHLIVPVSQRQQ